jgi:hypothetical protein
MATAINAEVSGSINLNHVDLGFYILTVILSEISNISYDVLPMLPFLLLPVILLMISILKSICNEKNFNILLILIYLTPSINNRFGFFPHDIGFTISLTIILLTIWCLRIPSFSYNKPAILFLLILSIISLNHISYKLTFFSIIFFVCLYIIESFEIATFQSKLNTKKNGFGLIALIGIVYVLSYNQWIYSTFFPRIMSTPDDRVGGFEKIFLDFFSNKDNLLSEYFFLRPANLLYAQSVWITLILAGVTLCSLIIVSRFIKREKFSFGEKFILALEIPSILVLGIYTFLGFADMGFLILTGIFCYSAIFQKASLIYRRLILLIILIFIILNSYIVIEDVRIQYYSGQKEIDYTYLESASKWYSDNLAFEYIYNPRYAITDVFTSAYFSKELSRRNISSNIPEVFSKPQLLTILKPLNNNVFSKGILKILIFNYREPTYTILSWDRFKSWSNYKYIIKTNRYINIVYSSNDIDIAFIPGNI